MALKIIDHYMMLHSHYLCGVVCDSLPKQSWFKKLWPLAILPLYRFPNKQNIWFISSPPHEQGMSCPSWQWHRTGSCWFPVQTLPVALLWCDLGFVPNSGGNKTAENLSPAVQTQWQSLPALSRKGAVYDLRSKLDGRQYNNLTGYLGRICMLRFCSQFPVVIYVIVCNLICSLSFWQSLATEPRWWMPGKDPACDRQLEGLVFCMSSVKDLFHHLCSLWMKACTPTSKK